MQVILRGKNLEIPERAQELIHRNAEKFSHFFDRVGKVEVTLAGQRYRYTAEVLLHAGRMVVFSEASAKTLLEAIDGAFDKATKKLKKQREKVTTRRRTQSPVNPPDNAKGAIQEERGIVL